MAAPRSSCCLRVLTGVRSQFADARRRLADAADPHHRALDRGRRRRHVRAPALRPFQRDVPRALLRGEPGRRRRADRDRRHRAGGAGRLHAHDLEHRLSRDRAGGQPQSRLRSDQGLHPYRLYRRPAQRVRGEPGARRALAQGPRRAWPARPGDRLRVAGRRHARPPAGGIVRAEVRHQAAADHDAGRLAGPDRPCRRHRECRHHDLDLGARPNPRRQGRPDRGDIERAARGIPGSADVQGAGLSGADRGVLVRPVGPRRIAGRHHAAAQSGGGTDARASRGAQAHGARRHRDQGHDLGRVHRNSWRARSPPGRRSPGA